MGQIIIKFRTDTLENWVKKKTILEKDEIAIIKFPDGHKKFVIGDGVTECFSCKQLNNIPEEILIETHGYDQFDHITRATLKYREIKD